MKIFVLVAAFALLTGLSVPASSAETGTVIGQGALTCKKFYKSSGRKENDFIVWVQGYFSAYNAIAPDIQNIASGHNFHWVLAQLKKFCKAHPEAYFNDAVQELVLDLHPKGIRTSEEPVVKITIEKKGR